MHKFFHRGLSVERGETEVGSKGRAVHRKDSSATGPSSLHSGSAASEPVVEGLAHRVMLPSSMKSELQLFNNYAFDLCSQLLQQCWTGARRQTSSRQRQWKWIKWENRERGEWERERGKCGAREHQGEEGQS